jgi:dipeptide/tripeptide permease
MSTGTDRERPGFPLTFWTANTIELFERLAYYAVASFVVIYLTETLGMDPAKATFLNGTILWTIVYLLPVLSGTLADRYGFKKSLCVAFVFITLGYFIVGTVQSFWPKLAGSTGPVDYTIPVLVGIVLIGVGGSVVKPCISGTVQKTSGLHTALGFAIFYMTINIGSMIGRTISYFVRVNHGIPSIFSYVATIAAAVGLLVTFIIFKEPRYREEPATTEKPKTLKDALLGMVTVLKDIRFVFFLVVIGLFWFIYIQIYQIVPLFLRFIDPGAAVELYTIVNPIMIVCFQLVITRFTKDWSDLKAIMAGIIVTFVGMSVNVLPFLMGLDIFSRAALGKVIIPLGGIFILMSIASMAVGEMLASPRIYRYIGAIAPKGKEGLYLGYANLPLAFASFLGGIVSGKMFVVFIKNPHAAGLPLQAPLMWGIIAFMGVLSLAGVVLYDRLLMHKGKEPSAPAPVTASPQVPARPLEPTEE